MATAEAQIVNAALQRVGETQFIDSLEDRQASARCAKVAWALVAPRLLECFEWEWAEGYAQLAPLAGEDAIEWTYAYAQPTNCAMPRRLLPADAEPFGRERHPGVPFTKGVKKDGGGKLLRANCENAWLIYTRNDIAVGLWPAHFVDAMAAALAPELALGLSKKPAVGLNFMQVAERALSVAKAYDLNTAQRKPSPASRRTRARYS